MAIGELPSQQIQTFVKSAPSVTPSKTQNTVTGSNDQTHPELDDLKERNRTAAISGLSIVSEDSSKYEKILSKTWTDETLELIKGMGISHLGPETLDRLLLDRRLLDSQNTEALDNREALLNQIAKSFPDNKPENLLWDFLLILHRSNKPAEEFINALKRYSQIKSRQDEVKNLENQRNKSDTPQAIKRINESIGKLNNQITQLKKDPNPELENDFFAEPLEGEERSHWKSSTRLKTTLAGLIASGVAIPIAINGFFNANNSNENLTSQHLISSAANDHNVAPKLVIQKPTKSQKRSTAQALATEAPVISSGTSTPSPARCLIPIRFDEKQWAPIIVSFKNIAGTNMSVKMPKILYDSIKIDDVHEHNNFAQWFYSGVLSSNELAALEPNREELLIDLLNLIQSGKFSITFNPNIENIQANNSMLILPLKQTKALRESVGGPEWIKAHNLFKKQCVEVIGEEIQPKTQTAAN